MLVILMHGVFMRQYRNVISQMAGTMGRYRGEPQLSSIRRAKLSK